MVKFYHQNEALKIVMLVSLFTMYTFGLLWLSNYALSHVLPGYASVEDDSLGLVVFFFAALFYAFYGRWKKWISWKYYVLGALTVYFPLVFIAASVQTIFVPDNAQLLAYSKEYCAVGEGICGKAFAHTIYSISLRALPTVLTAPALFWFLLFGRNLSKNLDAAP